MFTSDGSTPTKLENYAPYSRKVFTPLRLNWPSYPRHAGRDRIWNGVEVSAYEWDWLQAKEKHDYLRADGVLCQG